MTAAHFVSASVPRAAEVCFPEERTVCGAEGRVRPQLLDASGLRSVSAMEGVLELPLVAQLKPRQRGVFADVMERTREIARLIDEVGDVAPLHIVAAGLGVSRQRVFQLCKDGMLEKREAAGVAFVTRRSIEAYAHFERHGGRPVGGVSKRDLVKRVLGQCMRGED